MSEERQASLGSYKIVVALALVLVAAVFLPLWKPLLLAAVLAGALEPLHRRLAGRLGGRRSLAAVLTTLGLAVLVLLPLSYVITFLVQEAIGIQAQVRDALAKGGLPGLIALAPDAIEPALRKLLARLPSASVGLSEKATSQGVAAAAAVGTAVSKTSNMLFQAAMMLVALYFLLVDGVRLARWLAAVSPLGPEPTRELLSELRSTARATLTSTVATALVQGVAAGIGYMLARVPHPVFFALLTFVAAFIPSVGTAIVALPLAGLLALSGHYWAAAFLAGWGLLVVGTVDNILKPLLARSGANLHGALVFFSMIGGILFFGAAGLLVGPMAVTLCLSLIRLGRRYRAPGLAGAGLASPPGELPPPQPHA